MDGIGYVGEYQPAGPLQRALRWKCGLQRDSQGIRDLDQGHALSGPVTSILTSWCLLALGTSCAFCLNHPPCKLSLEIQPGSDDSSPHSHTQLAQAALTLWAQGLDQLCMHLTSQQSRAQLCKS